MKVIGVKKSDFRTKDGDEIKGYNIYVTDDIDPRHGQGQSCDRFYLSERKIANMDNLDVAALLGHNIKIYYTRFGKVESLEVLD